MEIEEEIAELKNEVRELKESIGETNLLVGFLAKDLSHLKHALETKKDKRRDYDLLAAELMKKVVSTRKYVDYRDIKNMFGFHGNEEAYRLMDRTVENYPETIVKRYVKNGKRGRHVLFLADM